MNVGSLFSGIGGIEIGFENEGFRTEWFVEYEPYPREILKKRFPSTIIYGDITQTDFTNVSRVDILTGGFPCQDISNAGKRVGITGSRSSLWKYYLEAIRILRPKYAIIENVSAIIGRGLDVILADLAKVGYDAEWHCLSASSIGALHRRDRIIIIAYPDSRGLVHGQSQEQSSEGWKQAQPNTRKGSSDISDSRYFRIGGEQREEGLSEASRIISYTSGFGGFEEPYWGINKSSMEHSSNNRWELSKYIESKNESFKGADKSCGWLPESEAKGIWAVEPGLGRVAHGVPNRVDRIKCLGNAVVPQFAQVIARTIKEYEAFKTPQKTLAQVSLDFEGMYKEVNKSGV